MHLRQANGIPVAVETAPSLSFVLSDSATTILRLAAAHDGVSEAALVTRLVCQHAERVGLPGLLDAGSGDICAVPDFARPNVKRTCR